MPTNIEIKARAREPAEQRRRAAELSGGPGERIEQEDVFFPAPHGRLKLRIFSPASGELIAYRRDDAAAARASEYAIAPTGDPAALRAALAAALGERVVVRKQRWLFLVGQTRIHLDEVEGLGAFVELEYVLRPGEDRDRGAAEVARLRGLLDIRDDDLVAAAYADLLQRVSTPAEILAFWRDAGPETWWSKVDAFDQACRDRLLPTHAAAARGDLAAWELTPEGALALVLLLDQLPRNMFRGTARVYQTDPAALATADRAIERGFDLQVEPALRRFFYMPFMHAESLPQQERSVALNEALGEDCLKWARHHRDIVARFGRFPHRNAILGRETTPEEQAFLQASDFKG